MEPPFSQPRAPRHLLWLLLLSLASTSCGRRVDLIHADSKRNLSPSQLLHLAVGRAQLRISILTNDPTLAPYYLLDGEYIAEIPLHSPWMTIQSIRGVLDTTIADLGVSQIDSGCGQYKTGPIQAFGYVGLGRGDRSLISRMGETKFSYCFTPMGSLMDSSLLLGYAENLDLYQIPKSTLQSVRLHQNSQNPSLYYLYMKAVTVGSSRLEIQKRDSYGNGALVLDSRASMSVLNYKLYDPILEAFRTQVQLPVANSSMVGLDLCFSLPPNRPTLADMKLPRLVFHFDGGDMAFPLENYMGVFEDAGLVCLMMQSFSRDSILGNFQQQNMRMIFDLEREELSFMESRCEDFHYGWTASQISAEHGKKDDAYKVVFSAG